MNCKPVLIVDDDEDIRMSASEALEWQKYRVLNAANGKEALDLLAKLTPEERPGLIILDMMMPVMDGQEFMDQLLRNHPNDLARIPIVVVSAKRDLGSVVGHQLLTAWLKKPIEIDDLFKMAQTYCGDPN